MASFTWPNPLEILQGDIAERSRGLKPLVKFNSVLHPAIVKALWRLIKHHLKDHIVRGNLEKSGTPHLALPEAFAPFAAIASPCHPFLFACWLERLGETGSWAGPSIVTRLDHHAATVGQ